MKNLWKSGKKKKRARRQNSLIFRFLNFFRPGRRSTSTTDVADSIHVVEDDEL